MFVFWLQDRIRPLRLDVRSQDFVPEERFEQILGVYEINCCAEYNEERQLELSVFFGFFCKPPS